MHFVLNRFIFHLGFFRFNLQLLENSTDYKTLKMDLLICRFEDCGLILENPVRLLCDNNIGREHLDWFVIKFKCPFCHKQHSVPEEGFFVNEEIIQKIK